MAFPELEPWDLDESDRIAVLEMIGELELAFEAEATTPEEEAGEECLLPSLNRHSALTSRAKSLEAPCFTTVSYIS